jgi:AraC family transcriptional regulator of adaptative response/methylated-DNA-[protein]-cysteine methyltransferase
MQAIMEPVKRSKSTYDSDAAKWSAVVRRDGAADGAFYYSVRTTGVYCRPSCGSRAANRRNVAFFETRGEAEAAGFRACRRCRPDEPALTERHAALVAAACRSIEAAESPPNLDELAATAGMSRYHFHRTFKAITGVTPKAYANAHRARRVRDTLREAPSVTAAMFDAGFNSNARFYAGAGEMLGMAPATYRAGGASETIRYAVRECSLGVVLVAATAKGVCAIALGDDADVLARDLQARFSRAQLVAGDADFERLIATVVALVEAPDHRAELPLDIRGTVFQQRVWEALRAIPVGATASYSEIARRVGAPTAVRAVAQACAANPIAVVIPCHRVVRSDGGISGYRWGVARKRALLGRESSQ